MKQTIQIRLKEILNQENAKCIVLDGEWGVGKTTFWKEFASNNFYC